MRLDTSSSRREKSASRFASKVAFEACKVDSRFSSALYSDAMTVGVEDSSSEICERRVWSCVDSGPFAVDCC